MTEIIPNVCSLCHRLEVPAVMNNCHYLSCPHNPKAPKPKMEYPLPVKVKNAAIERDGPDYEKDNNDLRTLWIVTNRRGLYAHSPFAKLFDGVLELKPHSIIRKGDVVFFDGGTDINPSFYGEEPHVATCSPDKARDDAERHAFARAQAAGASCLGVCRGAQLLCALSGGKLVQHVEGHNTGHLIFTQDGQAIFSESSHHQVMWPKEIPHVLIAWAKSCAQMPFEISDEYGKQFEDGELPEIIFCKDTRSLCIQGHAEYMGDPAIFTDFTRKLVREFLIEGK